MDRLLESPLEDWESQLAEVMLRDQFRLRQLLNRLKQPQIEASERTKGLSELVDRVTRSVELRRQRAERLPRIALDPELPIFLKQAEIAQAIRDHQVVVISGATGSGKSTQLPLIALQAGFGIRGMIGHTQPRRIAARSVANRIAQQLEMPLGSEVGFKIRFSDQTGEKTYVKVMTDGILLAEIQSDRYLEQYELIIIDEAHERSLNIDYLLGYLKKILVKRRELKLVITSATIDTERFAEHFSAIDRPVPTINVEGRTYPVEIRYQPPAVEAAEDQVIDIEDHLIATIRELAAGDSGDMLVFLPTENDIRSVHKKLRSNQLPRGATEILPLYARLSNAQQNEIFLPGQRRRIVLATNVAESSITVPRIRFVIDLGTARISHYAPRNKVQRLPIQPISQASADQRAGRCGRMGPGVCVRLYSETDFADRPKFTVPEIRRTNLASVILQTLSLRLGSVDEFPFLEPPRPDAIRDGYKTLFELGAVDDHRRLTPGGRLLARLPVDPRIGRMLFAAEEENCLSEVLVIASGLELQDPRVRPAEKKGAADQAHAKFRVEQSDFLTLLKIWDFFHELKSDLSKSRLKLACTQNFLSYPLMLQWQDIHRQLTQMIGELGLKPRKRRNDYAALHKSLLAGLLSGVAMAGDKHEYTGAGGLQFFLWPGSSLFKTKPQWIVAAEIVETAKRYGRMVAKIDPTWIEPLAGHLVKKRYSDPHWSRKKQSVQALEHVSLFGLPVVNGRPTNFGRIDPETSRKIFIEEALVNQDLQAEPNFYVRNRELIDEINKEMTKTRQRELIIEAYRLEEFYQERLPDTVYDKVSLLQAIKANPALDTRLTITRAALLQSDKAAATARLYPDEVKVGSMQIPVTYRFSPGESDDGATIRLPLAGLGQLDETQAGWLVPGLVESRMVALIRSLPKSLRRNLVPAPETAARFAQEIEFGKGNFYENAAQFLSKIGSQRIQVSDFDIEKLESHLKINVQVIGEDESVVAQGRSIAEVREQLGVGATTISNVLEVADSQWQQDNLQSWTWGDLPERVVIKRGETQLDAFPAIIDQTTNVGLRLTDSPTAARQQTLAGLVRLFQLANRKSILAQLKWLPDLDRQLIGLARFVPVAELKSQLADLMVRIAFVEREKLPRSETEFASLQSSAVERISMAAQEIAKWLPKFADSLLKVQLQLGAISTSSGSLKSDLEAQLTRLLPRDFLVSTPWAWLLHFPRYLEAMRYRMEKSASNDPRKDRESQELISRFWKAFERLREHQLKQGIVDPELTTFRWMIEELRVSLFAQPLGTSVKVSTKRLEQQFANCVDGKTIKLD